MGVQVAVAQDNGNGGGMGMMDGMPPIGMMQPIPGMPGGFMAPAGMIPVGGFGPDDNDGGAHEEEDADIDEGEMEIED